MLIPIQYIHLVFKLSNILKNQERLSQKFYKYCLQKYFFTSCATESINTVIRGVARANKNIGKRIITSTIEHSAVINTLKDLERNGFDVIYINVDKTGVIDLEQLANSINQNTILVSLMLANNEIGTIEPINEAYNLVKKINSNTYFHIDAVQALGKYPLILKSTNAILLLFLHTNFTVQKELGYCIKREAQECTPYLLAVHKKMR